MMRGETDNGLPQTILHVIDALNYGGAQKLLVLLAEWTPRNLYKTIICSLQTNAELQEQLVSKGVKVFILNRPRPSIFAPHRLAAYIYRNVKDLVQICRQEKVDIIQCHLSDAELLGILSGCVSGVKQIISTVHYPDLLPDRETGDMRNILRRLATKMIYRWSDHIIAVSEDVSRQLQAVFGPNPSKIRVVLNRIDVNAFADAPISEDLKIAIGIEPQNRIITTVGRLMPPKGHNHLIDAMCKLVPKFEGLKLLLVGNGDLKQILQRQCHVLGLQDTVLFLGSRRDIPDILALTEIFVLPSLWEGTSLALLEAMASGKPIVATDIPGNRTVLQHQINSLLVPPGDAEALADAMSFLLEHPGPARKYALKAHDTVQTKFDIRQTMKELEELWGKPASLN